MKNLKNSIIILSLIFTFYAVLSLSCATDSGVQETKKKIPVVDVSYDYESETPAVSVTVTPMFDIAWLPGLGGFSCDFSNNTNKIAKIVWDGSSINYKNGTFFPFIEGQKFVDANTPMPATVLPKGGNIEKMLYSSEQPHYMSSRWVMWPMALGSDEIKKVFIIFQVESENGTEYITVNIKYHYE